MNRLFLCVIFIGVFSLSLFASDQDRMKLKDYNILILSSYHSSFLWTEKINQVIQEGCHDLSFVKEVTLVNCDMLRLHDSVIPEKYLMQYLKSVAAGKYNMIIAIEAPIIHLLKKHIQEVPASVPIIICGDGKTPQDLKKEHPNLTGILKKEAPITAMKIGIKLYPDTKNIVVLADSLDRKKEIENRVKKYGRVKELKNIKFMFRDTEKESLNSILVDIANSPKETLVLVSEWRDFKNGSRYQLRKFMDRLQNVCKRPYIACGPGFFGHGAMGGVFTCPKIHGREVLRLVSEVIENGGHAEKLPIGIGVITPVYDAQVFMDYGLDLSKLPSDSRVLNRDFFFLKEHCYLIAFFCCFLLLLVVVVFYQYIMYRRFKSGQKLLSLFPGRMWVVDRSNTILFLSSSGLVAKGVESNMDTIGDIDYHCFSSCIQEVFKNKKSKIIDYNQHGQKYAVSFVSVPKRFLGKEAVVCFAYENEILQKHREDLATAYEQLESGANLTKSAIFRYNIVTKEITGSRLLSTLLPIRDGHLMDYRKWVVAEDQIKIEEKRQEVIDGKLSIFSISYRMAEDNSIRYYHFSCKREKNEKQEVILSGVVQDISDVKAAFLKYQKQNRLNNFIVGFLPFSFFVKDADDSFKYKFCNAQFGVLLGLTEKEIIGKTDRDFADSMDDYERAHRKDLEALDSLKAIHYEQEATNKKGVRKYFLMILKSYIDTNNHHLIMGAAFDITKSNYLLMHEKLNKKLSSIVVRNDIPTNEKFNYMSKVIMKALNCNWVVLGKLHPDGKLYSRYEWASSDELLLKSQNMKERWQKTLNKSIDTLRKYQIYKGYAGDDEGQEEALPSKSGIEMTEMNKKISYVIVPIFVEKKLWGALFVSFVTNIIEFNEISDRLLFTWADFWSIMVMNERQKKALLKADYEQKLFFENVHIPLWLHDASGKLLQYNSAVYDFFDIDHQPLTTKKNYELLTNAFAADADSAVEIIPTNEKSSARNISIANRKYILYNESLFDKKGTLIYVLKSAIDMTEQNKLFVRQSAMRDTLEALLKERDIKVAIRKATQILGKLLGVNCVFLFQFDAEQKTMSSFVENVTDEDSICFERAKNIPFAGVSFWVERLKKQSVFCINDLQNEPVERYGAYWEEIVKKRNISTVYVCGIRVESKLWGCLGVMSQGKVSFLDKDSLEFLTAFMGFIDAILEQNNTRMRLKKALDVATNANRAQSYFWSSVSHEIRTPLNSIIGFSELLSSGVSDPAIIKEYVDSISYSGNALLELVNDVLDLSKLEAKRMDVVLEPVCMAQICKDVMSIFNYAAIEKKIKLICDIPEMPKLMLDRSRIRQILVNLIGNAVKFTDKGSVTLRVEYEAKKNAMVNLSIAVIDTGIGVSEKDQKQLTKPFVQLSHLRGTNSENKGTGLGLAITKRMLKIMNGNLEIESTPGKGSCFRALLNSVKLASVFQGPVLGRCPIITKLPSPLSEIEKLSILIVDDVTMNLKVLEAILRKVGVEKIIKAGSGIEALAQLEKEEPSVVFTDMWMPEMSGEDLVKKMRLDPRWKRIPVYALTADIETTKTFNMDCFAGVLLKPVTLKQLTSVLQLLAKEL